MSYGYKTRIFKRLSSSERGAFAERLPYIHQVKIPTILWPGTVARTLTRVRAWVAHQALILRITSLAQVAHAFGRTESGLRHSVKLHFNYP